jgi:hypothetical protein
MDVRSYRGANIESDHYLVGIKLSARISNAKISTFKKIKRLNVEQLKIEAKASEFKEEIKLSIDQWEGEVIELLWHNCKTTLKEISEEMLGFNERQITLVVEGLPAVNLIESCFIVFTIIFVYLFKLSWREVDHSPPASAEVEKMWICTSTPIRLHGIVLK